MSLRQMSGWGKSQPAAGGAGEVPNPERCLTLLAEGTALNVHEIDAESYKAFRAKVSGLAHQISDRLPDDDKLSLIRTIVHEFESYSKYSERALRERVAGWRGLVAKLLDQLLVRVGIDPASADAASLVQRVGSLLTGEEIQGFSILLANLLRLGGRPAGNASALKVTDRSVDNHNAAGLRGGGAAVEHVEKIIEQGGSGFVVLFRLSCLEVIGERFGPEAVQDSMMAVSAFLTHSLRSDDAIYHWSDSSLLAILQSPATEQVLSAAMHRVVNNNRDITIQLGDRTVMLRVPLHFQITPISQLGAAEDLYKLVADQVKTW